MMTDLMAAVRWWVALSALGLVALPLLYTVLRRLPDRGYAFMRPAGLLLAGYVFWLAGSLGFAGNDGGGIVLALLVTGGLSWLAYRRRPDTDPGLREWLAANRRAVIATEVLFVAVFALWVWVRAQNPAISATEKPMEFAFLNGVGRSPAFPPLDPWLSGYAISYYYFGYVMTSFLARLAIVAEPVAFNLALAWLVAGTATGAFGLVVNLVSLRAKRIFEFGISIQAGESRASEFALKSEDKIPAGVRPAVTRVALLWGLVAALAVPLAGNLQVGLELLHGNGMGPDAFWAWLDVRDINGPAETSGPPRYETTGWWWWRTSRVIHEYHLSGRAEEGLEPIVEIPAFSFVLGDLHPHVLALPFALLSIGVALAWWLEIRKYEFGYRDDEWRPVTAGAQPQAAAASSLATRISYFVSDRMGVPLSLWLFTALVLGGLSFLNTWDVAIHLFLVLGAFFLAHWFGAGTTRGLWGRAAILAAALAIAAVILYLPFYLGFRSQAGAPFLLPFLMRPTRLAHYLIIFGMPLLAVTAFVLVLAARQRFRHWKTGVATAAVLVGSLVALMLVFTLIMAAGPDNGRLVNLAAELGVSFSGLLPVLLGARLASPWLVLYLAGLLALVVMVLRTWVEIESPQRAQREDAGGEGDPVLRATSVTRGPSFDISALAAVDAPPDLEWATRAAPFALLLVLTGVLLTLGPEFLYLRDNFGVRLNTTFKFYYQAWVMFNLAAVFGLDYLWAIRRSAAGRVAAYATTAAYVGLLAVALMFPILAVNSRAAEYRGPARDATGAPLERQPATLDGLAYLNRFNPSEYEAIMWLRRNAPLGAVVLEAVGGQYSGYGRVSANTGLPTLLGWPGHELQWRGSDHPEPGRREPIVEQIYTATHIGVVGFLLDQFNVTFIYVGDLEREKYGTMGLNKFAEELEVAFANDRVTIYRWQPAGLN